MKPKLASLSVALLIITLAASMAGGPSTVMAFPEPSIAGLALQWRYEFEDDRLGCIAVPTLEGGMDYYWYFRYTVENNSGQDRFYAPEFEIITDNSSEIITANKSIPPQVYEAVLTRLQDPKVMRPAQVVGKFGQGVTNAKDSVAVWPNPKKHFDQMTIFVAGLSGEEQRWTYGRFIQVTDKRVSKVVFNKELKTAADRSRVPRSVLRNLKHVDLKIEELEKIEDEKIERDGPRGSSIVIESTEKSWVITYEDLIFKIRVTQLKKGSFDTQLRRQRRLVYELPGKPITPDKYEVTDPKKDWIMR